MQEELLARIRALERSLRRWKSLALALIVILLLILIAGGGAGFLLVLGTVRLQQTELQALRAEQRAITAAFQAAAAGEQAERARLEAVKQIQQRGKPDPEPNEPPAGAGTP